MNKYIRIMSIVVTMSLLSSSTLFAQKAKVEERLKEYGIPHGFFENNLKDENANHSFNIETTTKTGTDTKVEVGSFNPTLPEGKRWSLIFVDGKTPTKKQIKQFNKAHNSSENVDFGEPEDNDWKIIEDSESELIVELRYRKENLPHKYKFLAGCKGKVFVNKNSKQIEKMEFNNIEPLKVKIFNVSKLDMIVYYKYDESSNTYLIEKEETLMDANLLGQSVQVEMISLFSDYNKVN